MLTPYSIIQKSGGISLSKSRHDHNTKEDFIQSGLMGVFQDRSHKGIIGKGRRALDDLAGELISRGIIPIPDDCISEGDYLLQLLQEERLGNPVTIEQLENYENELETEEYELQEEIEIYGEKNQEDLEGFTREVEEDTGETGIIEADHQGGKKQGELTENIIQDIPTYRHTDIPTYRHTDIPTYQPVNFIAYHRNGFKGIPELSRYTGIPPPEIAHTMTIRGHTSP